MEGQKILLVFDDGKEGARRVGKVTKVTEFSIILDSEHIIPKHRIYRMKILEEE